MKKNKAVKKHPPIKENKKIVNRLGEFFVLLVLLAAIFLFVQNGGWVSSKNTSVYSDQSSKPEIGGILKVTYPIFDFGTVSVNKGVVTTNIPIFNLGEDDLSIYGLDTSCGCTSASIINHGIEGPIFQMAGHGKNPKGWLTTIKPGGKASLMVYYDPYTHPDLRGHITRTITILSNDSIKPTQQVRIRVNQIE